MSIWSVWTNQQRNEFSLVRGSALPCFANGTPDAGATVLLWRFEAANYEEAATLHHLRLGWAPYKPVGPAANCPICSAVFYPQGSGECSCGYTQIE